MSGISAEIGPYVENWANPPQLKTPSELTIRLQPDFWSSNGL
jgi:hypothetical protein